MFDTIYGVDFSGARLAGRHAWVARIERAALPAPVPYKLTRLARLDALAGAPEREAALAYLVKAIAASDGALWALGFPFGLPVEVLPQTEQDGWASQLEFLRGWGEDAYAAGVECLNRAKALGHKGHIRRLTDTEMLAPWDTYSYRIIYQTFYGMRDVLGELWGAAGTAILPFDYDRLADARRVIVEACPASTLKRLGLPHQGYKQSGAAALTAAHRRVRRQIIAGLAAQVLVGRVRRRLLMQDPDGDALDAVVAAVGAAGAWAYTDHKKVAVQPRYVREGRTLCSPGQDLSARPHSAPHLQARSAFAFLVGRPFKAGSEAPAPHLTAAGASNNGGCRRRRTPRPRPRSPGARRTGWRRSASLGPPQ